jgi:hypothetical protein
MPARTAEPPATISPVKNLLVMVLTTDYIVTILHHCNRHVELTIDVA